MMGHSPFDPSGAVGIALPQPTRVYDQVGHGRTALPRPAHPRRRRGRRELLLCRALFVFWGSIFTRASPLSSLAGVEHHVCAGGRPPLHADTRCLFSLSLSLSRLTHGMSMRRSSGSAASPARAPSLSLSLSHAPPARTRHVGGHPPNSPSPRPHPPAPPPSTPASRRRKRRTTPVRPARSPPTLATAARAPGRAAA